jgi:predicted transcriptional regulator
MPMPQRPFSLKMNDTCDDPCGIILSFDSKWLEPIKAQAFQCIFRKMGPHRFVPTHIYAYLAKPTSAIVAKMPVTSFGPITLSQAEAIASSAMLTPSELRAYADKRTELVIYHVGPISVARTPIAFEVLKQTYQFWPSSNYIPLSPQGSEVLDDLGSFSLTSVSVPKQTSGA